MLETAKTISLLKFLFKDFSLLKKKNNLSRITVVEIIDAFKDLSQFGAGDPTLVADSISKALITTAAGLSIAIPALVVYNLLTKKIEEIEEEIDKITTNVINIVRG